MNRQALVRFIYTYSCSSQNCTCKEACSQQSQRDKQWEQYQIRKKKYWLNLKSAGSVRKYTLMFQKHIWRKPAPSQLQWAKRQLEHSGDSEGRQKECLGGKKINNFRSWQSTLRTLSELCYPSRFVCPQAEQKWAQKRILQVFFKIRVHSSTVLK